VSAGDRPKLIDRGLDLLRPDAYSETEGEVFRQSYEDDHGAALAAYDFWLRWRPDVLKRHRLQAYVADQSGAWFTLLFLHYYTVIAFEEGIAYQAQMVKAAGLTRDEVLETLAVAFLHAGPYGMTFAERATRDVLPQLLETRQSNVFPAGWRNDPEAFHSGLDFTTIGLSPAERSSLVAWYERTIGEVPRYVQLLLKYSPDVLKAWRSRFETALARALPKQMMPFLLLHLNVSRGFDEGVREQLLLARAFGVSRELAVRAIVWGGLYGGTAGLSIADRAAGDILERWQDP
jgi:hypothetical protein